MRRIVFNCNQTQKQGLGHFLRCLNLARHMKIDGKFQISFAGAFSPFSLSALNKEDIKVVHVISDAELFKYLNYYDYIITDRYDIDQKYLNTLTDFKGIKSIIIDDFNTLNFSNQDLVINFRVGVDHYFYGSKSVALGEKFFIFKPEFNKIRENYQFSSSVKSVLFFGTGTNKNTKIFKDLPSILINKFPDIKIMHITNDPLLIQSKSYTPKSLNNSIEEYFRQADAIVNGGGLIKYEAAFCGIPSATLSTTIEQHEDTKILAQKGLLYDLGCQHNYKKEEVEKRMVDFIMNSNIRFDQNKKGLKFFMPNSINNLIQKINEI